MVYLFEFLLRIHFKALFVILPTVSKFLKFIKMVICESRQKIVQSSQLRIPFHHIRCHVPDHVCSVTCSAAT